MFRNDLFFILGGLSGRGDVRAATSEDRMRVVSRTVREGMLPGRKGRFRRRRHKKVAEKLGN